MESVNAFLHFLSINNTSEAQSWFPNLLDQRIWHFSVTNGSHLRQAHYFLFALRTLGSLPDKMT